MPANSPVEMASARFFADSGPPLVWTRNSGGCHNIVVMNDDQIAVGTLPRSKRKAAREELEGGTSIETLLGPQGTRIRFQAVHAVTACLNGTQVEVRYDTGGGRLAACRFPTASREVQADILVEARSRLKGQTQVVESRANRLTHAMQPFNLLMIFAVLSIGVQNYFTTTVFDGKANRQRLEKWDENAKPKDLHLARARQQAYVSSVTANPVAQKALIFGIIILGVVGAVLNTLGYAASMTVLLGGTCLTLAWTLGRLFNPPRTLSVVACRQGG